MSPHAAIADEHSHPHQEMIIKVLSGTLTCTIDGRDEKIGAGKEILIPAGVNHFQRNDSDVEVQALEEYRPALQMQEFFETLIGWSNDGKTNEAGLPGLLRLAVLQYYFKHTIRSSSKKRNLISRMLAPIGIALGYRREVEHYIRLASLEQ